MSWAEVKRAEKWFGLHGTFFVFLGRLLPTVRSLVSIPAGLLKMSFRRFMLASILGTGIWTALLAGAGYKLGENYTDVDKVIGPAANAIMVVLVAIWRGFCEFNLVVFRISEDLRALRASEETRSQTPPGQSF